MGSQNPHPCPIQIRYTFLCYLDEISIVLVGRELDSVVIIVLSVEAVGEPLSFLDKVLREDTQDFHPTCQEDHKNTRFK